MWATYFEWKRQGLVVDRGERSVLKDPNGFALFHHSQTVKPDEEEPREWAADYDEYLHSLYR
jgi:hypothetical protein